MGKDLDLVYSREMFQNLTKMRENHCYTDVTLRVKGKIFHAHKVLLATSSRFFDAMFSAELKESTQNEVELQGEDLTAEAFETILNFIYSSVLPLTEDNVLDVLEAADHLQILSVVKKCSLFIGTNLSRDKFHMETQLKIRRVAERHNLTELREESLQALALKFGEICEEDGFMKNITVDELELLLPRNDLSVPSETFLFTTVITWMKYDKENRLPHAPRLLNKVRLALVDIMVVLSELESEEFKGIPECFSLMHNSLSQHARPFLFSSFAQEKGMPRLSSKALVSLSCLSEVKYFDSVSKSWKPFPGLELPSLQIKPAALYTGNYLFLFDEKDVHQHQLDTHAWKTLPPMRNTHCNFQVCMLEDFLYVIGGSEVNHTVVSERFSFSKKTWQRLSFHVDQGLYGCAVAVHNGYIYSIGGSWAEGGADRGVFRFNPLKNEWAKLAGTVYSHTQACAFEAGGRLYVAGGKTDPPSKRQRGLVPSSYVEVYDEENNLWCSVPQPHIPPGNFGAVEIEDHIYFILGNIAFDSGIRIGAEEVYHVNIEDWEPISQNDTDAVFVYMPVNRTETDQMKQELTENHEASDELLLENS